MKKRAVGPNITHDTSYNNMMGWGLGIRQTYFETRSFWASKMTWAEFPNVGLAQYLSSHSNGRISLFYCLIHFTLLHPSFFFK